jgi:P4 family phage/plasmid primase-like protien
MSVQEEIERTIATIRRPGEIIEIRIPKAGYSERQVFAGFFENGASIKVDKYNGHVRAIYTNLNPIKPALMARACNRVDEKADKTVQDGDVMRRSWLFIDIDPRRPAGISSTNEEHELAIAKAHYINERMLLDGWEAVIADSGNGASLLYKIDLPNDEPATALIKIVLEAFDFVYSDSRVEIDLSVFNASRIIKLYGTEAKKGDNTLDQPHRVSKILRVPATITTVTKEQLVAMAQKLPKEPKEEKVSNNRVGFDIEAWMKQFDLIVSDKKAWNGGILYRLETCPFNSNHKTPDSAIIKHKSGAISFQCFHSSCSSHDWAALRSLKEPDRVQRKELAKKAASEKSTFNGNEYILTDLGNAKRLASVMSDDARYCYPYKTWIFWNGKRWAEDKTGMIERYAMDAILNIYDEARGISDIEERQKLLSFAVKSESAASIRNMIELARPLDNIPITPDQMDLDPMLFNVQNGTIDLRTGQLKTHDRNDKITKISPVIYDPLATCPRWMEFLSTIFSSSKDMIDYLQKQSGYALTGETKEEDFSIHYGTGGNGKSKFNDEIAYIEGDYFVKANVETILNSKNTKSGSAASGDVARLAGARLVIASEPERGAELKEGFIKDLTGREQITARRLYEREFQFKPTFKFWLITNHKPIVKSQDNGMWRRVKLVPFEVTIPEDQRDLNLDIKLKEESSGILNWIIEGCLKWQKEGIKTPDIVKNATTAYKEDMDTLGDFYMLCCDFGDKKAKTPNKWLYNWLYLAWCEITNNKAWSQKAFTSDLQGRGYKNKRFNNGMTWVGVGLKLHLLEKCCEVETQSGNGYSVGLQDVKIFLETFLSIHAREKLLEKPTQPSHPTLNQGNVSETSLEINDDRVKDTLHPYIYEKEVREKSLEDPIHLTPSTSFQETNSEIPVWRDDDLLDDDPAPCVNMEEIVAYLKTRYDTFNKPDTLEDLNRLKKSMALGISAKFDLDGAQFAQDYCRARGW